MKNMYTSPELEIVKFAAAQQLAADNLEPSGGEITVPNEGAEPFNSGNGWNN